MQTTMTSNNIENRRNTGNIVYDIDKRTTGRNNRVGISATEIELLSDIPLASERVVTSTLSNPSNSQISSSHVNNQQQPNNYQVLSFNREQPKSNGTSQDDKDKQLNSTVDKLLEKYAPDAIPKDTINVSTSSQRQPSPPNPNATTAAHDPSLFSTFQPTANNYSTVIRPNTGQIPQRNAVTNDTYGNNKYTNIPTRSSRPLNNYDSFQHNAPIRQSEQNPPPPHIPVKTKDGNVAQVVPGRLYTLTDDPLHLLYDRQYSNTSNATSFSQSKPSAQTTFQPSNHFETPQEHVTNVFANTSNTNAQKPTLRTTDGNYNGMQSFDLANLIKNVQQDYLREIQPFVSSAKFVQKDSEFGQNVGNIDFVAPVTVRQGFTGQADDILRRSFSRRAQKSQSASNQNHNDVDLVGNLHESNKYPPFEKLDSRQPFSSLTSVSPYNSDYEDEIDHEPKKNLHDQGTSPPPQFKQPHTKFQLKNPPATSKMIPTNPMTTNEIESATPKNPTVPKFARRISPDRSSMASSEEDLSIDEDDYPAKYNEHDHKHSSFAQPNTVGAIDKSVSRAPIQESVPPTIHKPELNATSATDPRHPLKPLASDESLSYPSRSDQMSDSDNENNIPTSSAGAYNVQQHPISTPGGRNAPVPQTGRDVPLQAARDAPPQTGRNAPPQTGRDAPPQTGRDALSQAAKGAPPQTGRDAPSQTPPHTGCDAQPQAGRVATPQTGRDAPPQTGRDAPPQAARGATPQTGIDVPPQAARGATPQTGRDAPPQAARGATPQTGRDAPAAQASARVTTAQGASSTARATTDNNARQAVASSGSTRLFQSDNDSKFGQKRSLKDMPAAFGNRIKGIFHRKNSPAS
ncbi:unnamed protein product [Rotaria socialis]|uniref:Uncharacterized protein n=3 Tax=Rotaria socialis TaxID=392032 RepID=A0A817SLC0_9BILA|nr:unnamed protein product [Rotaria socialis]